LVTIAIRKLDLDAFLACSPPANRSTRGSARRC